MNQTSDTVADVLGDELMTRDAVEVSATDAGIPERPLLCVGILWKRDPLLLPRSYNITLKQLANKEKRLTRDPVCIAEHTYVTNKCKEKGYVAKVPTQNCDEGRYLPHFPVIKVDRQTMNMRIAYDAVAKAGGVSLNSAIHSGQKLQRNIANVLLKFRQKPAAVVCDVTEMYRQIELLEADRKYHHFWW